MAHWRGTVEPLARLEAALSAGGLPGFARALRDEGRTIREAYQLIYGVFQTHLQSTGRADDVHRLLAACAAVQGALAATFEKEMRERLDRSLRERSLRRLIVDLHDREAWSKQRIYDTLLAFTFVLRNDDRPQDEARVEDELDALSGCCAPAVRLWPDEKTT